MKKNRWLIAASAVGIHASIGSIYAYSAWKMPLENTFGWSSTKTSLAFSIAIFCLGLTAAFLGPYIQRLGATKGSLLAALCFSAGLIGAGIATHLENLVGFYLSFGVISGIGLGIGYIAPIATLVKWFPDRRGLATGLAIMGFGFGGLICTQLIDSFVPAQAEISVPSGLSTYEYLQAQTVEAPMTETIAFSTTNADTANRTTLIYDKGDITRGFICLGFIYLGIMLPAALYITPPPEGYERQFTARISGQQSRNAPLGEMTAQAALRRPGFYGLWLLLFLNASCGIAVISTAKKMGYEMVHLSDGLASIMIMGISLFNGLGRIGWATLSDRIGRSNTFTAFFIIQIVAFPLLANVTGVPWLFMLVTFCIITCYGGAFSTIPAYIGDLYGVKSMPTLLGYVLTAWSMAGFAGPMLNAYVYELTHSYQLSLYAFGITVAIALVVSLAMRTEARKLRKHYQMQVDEDALNNTELRGMLQKSA